MSAEPGGREGRTPTGRADTSAGRGASAARSPTQAAVVPCGNSDVSGLRGLTRHDPGSSLDRGALDGRCCEHSSRDVRVKRRTGNAGDRPRGRRAATGQRTATAGSVVADPAPRAVPYSPVQLRSTAATVPRRADREHSVAAAHVGLRSGLHDGRGGAVRARRPPRKRCRSVLAICSRLSARDRQIGRDRLRDGMPSARDRFQQHRPARVGRVASMVRDHYGRAASDRREEEVSCGS